MAELVLRKITWNENLAYCVGLLASDGNLSKDGRHIIFVSKDKDLVRIFKAFLCLKNKISVKNSGYSRYGKYYYLQFGDVKLYHWLNEIGMKPNKSKSIGTLSIPNRYFFHFLRGLLDGDGCITSFRHPESKQLQVRVKFCSASRTFLDWLKSRIYKLSSIEGKIELLPRVFDLVYYKLDSIRLLRKIYAESSASLERKRQRALLLLKGGWCNWQTREA